MARTSIQAHSTSVYLQYLPPIRDQLAQHVVAGNSDHNPRGHPGEIAVLAMYDLTGTMVDTACYELPCKVMSCRTNVGGTIAVRLDGSSAQPGPLET